jgi:hypothetical protein
MLFSWTPIDATSCFHDHPQIRHKPGVVCCSISIGNKSVVFFQRDPQTDRTPLKESLVSTLEGRNGLALVLIQSTRLNSTVAELDVTVGLLLPCESVLHPVLVITVGEVLTGVSTTGLLTVGGSQGGLGTVEKLA